MAQRRAAPKREAVLSRKRKELGFQGAPAREQLGRGWGPRAKPRYLASGAACPCARRTRRLGSASRPSPAPGALALRPRIQTAWCSPLPTPAPFPLPALAARWPRQLPRRARGAGPGRQLLTLGVAEVSRRGSRLRSAEQRCRLPRAAPLGPREELEEQEWGSAARPHNAQRAGGEGAGRALRGAPGALCRRGSGAAS